jgi:hypothetical protein
VIYVLSGYLAFDLARHGSSPAQASGDGTLHEVARQPAGPALLAALAVGLGAYAAWRFVQALAAKANPEQRSVLAQRIGWLATAAIYLWLCLQSIELIVSRSSTSRTTGSPEPWAAKALSWPAGSVVLGIVGACLILAGATLAIWGFAHDFDKDLALEQLSTTLRRSVKALGATGDLARGFLVSLVGVYLMEAAVVGNPALAKSTDEALKSLLRTPYGPSLIALVAVGLVFYGLYSFSEGRLRRI